MSIFKKLFHKQSEVEQELEIEQEIIENNAQQKQPTAIIIKYIISDEDAVPEIKQISYFHNDIMPDINSIIWAKNDSGTALIPYKVIRFDFIEDEDENILQYVYIVVTNAKYNDIMK